MASCTVQGCDELIRQLDSLGSGMDDIAKKCLDEAAPIVVEAWQKELDTHHGDGSGQLRDSIKASKAKYSSKYDDMFVKIQPQGYAEYTYEPTGNKRIVANAIKANVLEYGSSKQQATPTLAPAVEQTRDQVMKSMQATFDRLAGDNGGN